MHMVIEVDEHGTLVLKEIYNGVMLETSEGNRIGICMRDDTFEINVCPKDQRAIQPSNWWRVDMQRGNIRPLLEFPVKSDG